MPYLRRSSDRSSGATYGVAASVPPLGGSLLVAAGSVAASAIDEFTGTAGGVALPIDTLGNSWQRVAIGVNHASLDERPYIFAAYCPVGGANTVNFQADHGKNSSFTVLEFTGGPTSLQINATNSDQGNSATPSVNLTGVLVDDLIIGLLINSAGVATPGGLYTADTGGSFNWSEDIEYDLQAAAGVVAVDFARAGPPNFAILAASFKLLASGGSGTKKEEEALAGGLQELNGGFNS